MSILIYLVPLLLVLGIRSSFGRSGAEGCKNRVDVLLYGDAECLSHDKVGEEVVASDDSLNPSVVFRLCDESVFPNGDIVLCYRDGALFALVSGMELLVSGDN
ncbi:hypothetical protein RRG08_015593 [Elysia crispata]|uniref:Uncharacterized protein n=1 Tax=Elysia crispata TaxID=231223 RepID=A0AAE1CWL5_9GAST|nr:hypothetical protein RRG08_015593 [Elysia crispata]